MVLLIALGFKCELGWVYATGLVIVGLLLMLEHRLVSPEDLTRLNIAFFHTNSAISIVLFTSVLVAYWIKA